MGIRTTKGGLSGLEVDMDNGPQLGPLSTPVVTPVVENERANYDFCKIGPTLYRREKVKAETFF